MECRKINGEWLHLDLTWDDPVSSDGKDYLYHKYFLIDTEELITADANITSEDHVFDKTIYSELKILRINLSIFKTHDQKILRHRNLHH